jgi:uncharacterized Zn-finger protein
MGVTSKLANKIRSFDQPRGAPIGSMVRFHEPKWPLLLSQKNPQTLNGGLLETQKTYADGLEEGRMQAQLEAEGQTILVTQAVQELLCVGKKIEASHGRVILTILRATLPALARRNIAEEIKDFVLNIAAQTLQGCVTIQTPSFVQHHLEAALLAVATHSTIDTDQFTIQTTENLSDTHVRASWQGGGAEVDIDGVVQACLTLLETNYTGDEHDQTCA